MAMAKQSNCAHPQCTCPITEGQEYCGQNCANSARNNEVDVQSKCSCGHPGCKSASKAA